MDKKLEKLEFLRDGFWKLFTQTGSVYAYGRYNGAKELIKEHLREMKDQRCR